MKIILVGMLLLRFIYDGIIFNRKTSIFALQVFEILKNHKGH